MPAGAPHDSCVGRQVGCVFFCKDTLYSIQIFLMMGVNVLGIGRFDPIIALFSAGSQGLFPVQHGSRFLMRCGQTFCRRAFCGQNNAGNAPTPDNLPAGFSSPSKEQSAHNRICFCLRYSLRCRLSAHFPCPEYVHRPPEWAHKLHLGRQYALCIATNSLMFSIYHPAVLHLPVVGHGLP